MNVDQAIELSKLAEVEWGVEQEERVLARWAKRAPQAKRARGFLKAGPKDDFDFVVFDRDGLVLCYLEVKVRRTSLAQYGDAMFPRRKYDFALRVMQKFRTPVVAVVEYGCGSLVQVALSRKPAYFKDVTRRDRPGKSVPHAFYTEHQLTLLEKGRK